MIQKSLLVSKSTAVCPDSYKWSIRQYLVAWLFWIQKWRHNAQTREKLANLPAYLLRDLGLSEEQVRHEVQKKFWQ